MSAEPIDLTVGPPGTPEVDVEPGRRPPPSADPVDVAPETEEAAPPVSESAVRTILAATGRFAHHLTNLEDEQFLRFTDDELDGICPPLTRIINRRPRLRAAVHRGDGVAVALELSSYTGRNIKTWRAHRSDHEPDHQEEQTGDDERREGGPVPRGAPPGPQAEALRRAGGGRAGHG